MDNNYHWSIKIPVVFQRNSEQQTQTVFIFLVENNSLLHPIHYFLKDVQLSHSRCDIILCFLRCLSNTNTFILMGPSKLSLKTKYNLVIGIQAITDPESSEVVTFSLFLHNGYSYWSPRMRYSKFGCLKILIYNVLNFHVFPFDIFHQISHTLDLAMISSAGASQGSHNTTLSLIKPNVSKRNHEIWLKSWRLISLFRTSM